MSCRSNLESPMSRVAEEFVRNGICNPTSSPLPPIRPMSVCLCLLTDSTSRVKLFVLGPAIQGKPSICHPDFWYCLTFSYLSSWNNTFSTLDLYVLINICQNKIQRIGMDFGNQIIEFISNSLGIRLLYEKFYWTCWLWVCMATQSYGCTICLPPHIWARPAHLSRLANVDHPAFGLPRTFIRLPY